MKAPHRLRSSGPQAQSTMPSCWYFTSGEAVLDLFEGVNGVFDIIQMCAPPLESNAA